MTGWEDYESVMDQDLALNVKDDDRRSELYDSNTSLDAMITAIMSSDECATTRLGGHTTDCESPASRLTGVDVALDNSGPLAYGGRSKNDGRMDYLGFVDHTYNTAFLEQEQTTLFNDPILSAPSRMDGGYTGDIDDGDSRVGDDDDDNFFFWVNWRASGHICFQVKCQHPESNSFSRGPFGRIDALKRYRLASKRWLIAVAGTVGIRYWWCAYIYRW